jgi:hypothetical protein
VLISLAATAADPAPSSPLEIWLRFASTIAAIIGTGLVGWLATRAGQRRIEATTEETKEAAQAGAIVAEPLGAEGLTFTESVLASLADLKAGQAESRQQLMRHLEDHASSDLRRPHRA